MSEPAVSLPPDDFEMNDLTDPVPEGLGAPFAYRIFVMPVKPKRQVGSILLADESVDAQQWLNCIGRIVAMGSCAFTHPRWKELGLRDEDTPKVGDLVLYASRTPHRFKFKGANILVIHDEWITGFVDEAETAHYKFYL